MLIIKKENIEKLKMFTRKNIDKNTFEYFLDLQDTDGLLYQIRFSKFDNYGYFNMEISTEKYKLGLINYSVLYQLIKQNILENI